VAEAAEAVVVLDSTALVTLIQVWSLQFILSQDQAVAVAQAMRAVVLVQQVDLELLLHTIHQDQKLTLLTITLP
jgi:hypothetical protein